MTPGTHFDVSSLPTLEGLNTIDLNGLPGRDWGCASLSKKVPKLASLTLSASETLEIDGRLPPADYVSLRGARLQGSAKLPKRVDHVGLHFAEFDDERCDELLAPVRSIRSLGLRGTPISAAAMERIVRRFEIEHLDAVDCGLSRDAVHRLAEAFPNLRLLPNYRATSE